MYLQVGDKHPGSVLSLTEHGIFISFGNGIVGLCPERVSCKLMTHLLDFCCQLYYLYHKSYISSLKYLCGLKI